MSSVLKNLRTLSSMEFYKNAIRMRSDLTDWLLRDFGTKRNKKNINRVIKNIEQEDKDIIDSIFAKYGKNPNQEFQSEFPEWFIDYERTIVTTLLHDLVANITAANSIYAIYTFEFDLRREYQDKAIINCYQLYQELQYIVSIIDTDLNKLIPFLESIEKEIDLLKGWRQSDNKKRKSKDEIEVDKAINCIESLKMILDKIKNKIKKEL